MASIYDDIRAALEVKLSAVTDVPSIGWENAQFSPTTGQPYVKPRLMPTRREPAVRGPNPQMYYQGLFRIECYVPEGAGPSAGDELADKLIGAFEATTSIYYNNVTDALLTEDGAFLTLESGSRVLLDDVTHVSIRYAEREMAEIDGPFYMIPVNIGWYIYK
jgi:hypothetical protein